MLTLFFSRGPAYPNDFAHHTGANQRHWRHRRVGLLRAVCPGIPRFVDEDLSWADSGSTAHLNWAHSHYQGQQVRLAL